MYYSVRVLYESPTRLGINIFNNLKDFLYPDLALGSSQSLSRSGDEHCCFKIPV